MFGEHRFRHDYAKLVAVLTRQLGARYLPDIEDAVQGAMVAAVQRWGVAGAPDNPTAWLYHVAKNQVLANLRTAGRRRRLLERNHATATPPADREASATEPEYLDSLLHMLFLSCDDAVPDESRLAFMLKTLCGFSTAEIAARLFASEESVYKRLSRARDRLRESDASNRVLRSADFEVRTPSVRRVLYLMFSEGYLSIDGERSIRLELCEEAIRLGLLLADHPTGEHPETSALVALMLLNFARLNGREGANGGLLLLEEQDRGKWDHELIVHGLEWLQKSASGEHFTRYHCEAGIAATHCIAPSFAETQWGEIAKNYEVLFSFSEIPVHRLNHALAIAEIEGPAAGLASLRKYRPPSWLTGSYLWAAVMADLSFRNGEFDAADENLEVALATAPSEAIANLIRRRSRKNQGVEPKSTNSNA
ncbi:MAG: sigma-70 family RNA polymerase sigma factor [Planctomycetota bacterium]